MMNSNRPRLAVALTICLISACERTNDTNQDATSNSIISYDGTTAANLGQAYDSRINKIFGYGCVDGESETKGGLSSQIEYFRDLSSEQLQEKIAIGLGVTVGVGTVNVTPAVAYTLENAADSLTSTQTVAVKVRGRSVRLKRDGVALSGIGQRLVHNHHDNVFQWCGNEYVGQIDYGASLLATLRYTFASTRDKQSIGGSLGVGVGPAGFFDFIGLRLGLKTVVQVAKERATVHVSGLQLGGQPEQLTQALPAEVISCRLSEPERCLAAFDSILQYARDGFPRQLEQGNNLVPIQYVTVPYSEAGAAMEVLHESETLGALRESVILKVQNLQRLLDSEMTHYRTATKLLASHSFSEARRVAIHEIQQLALQNALVCERAVRACRKAAADQCLVQSPELTSYSAEILSLNYGKWRERLNRGDIVALKITNLPDVGSGDETTRVVIEKELPGRRRGKISDPAKLAGGEIYLIRQIRRPNCKFPVISSTEYKGCTDARYSDNPLGYTAYGLNASMGKRMSWTFFNVAEDANEISVWGFLFTFDPESGEVFSQNGSTVGALAQTE